MCKKIYLVVDNGEILMAFVDRDNAYVYAEDISSMRGYDVDVISCPLNE